LKIQIRNNWKRNFKEQKLAGRLLNQINVKHVTPLEGEIYPPPDKSISHRAVILSSLSEGRSSIKNFLRAEDPLRTLRAFQQMGIEIQEKDEGIIVHGKGLNGLEEPLHTIDCGNSGTTMRLLCGVLAGQPFSSTLTGDDSLIRRPMQRVINPLTKMGARIESKQGGYPPLTINKGTLRPIDYESPIASAQIKTAILLAGLYSRGITSVTEPDKSRDHTERMLKAAGVTIDTKGLKVSVTGEARIQPLEITIPGDFSSAAFFIVAGTLIKSSKILIKNVGINPTRTGLIDILDRMGANIIFQNKKEVSGEPVADIFVRYAQLCGIEISNNLLLRAIDEFPILCIAASAARGTTKITGAKELRVKESDRIASMAKELTKMNVEVDELEDGIIIKGTENLQAATVQSFGDHRVAMALTIAGLKTRGEITVEGVECINTSFPGFFDILNTLKRTE
jgi:3-phosphoshikimate 1-carboxyvinyltransferase